MNVGLRIPTKVDTEPPDRPFDLRQYLNFVWRNWMFIASVTALALLVGVIYLVRATPLYTATTQVLLEQRENAPTLDAVVNDTPLHSYSYVDNQLAILRVRPAAAKGRHQGAACATDYEGIAGAQPPKKTIRHRREGAIIDGINRLRGALAVSRSGQAEVLNIAITGKIRSEAAQLANAVADAYVVDQLDARLSRPSGPRVG